MALVLLALAVLVVAVTMIPVSIILAKDFIKVRLRAILIHLLNECLFFLSYSFRE